MQAEADRQQQDDEAQGGAGDMPQGRSPAIDKAGIEAHQIDRARRKGCHQGKGGHGQDQGHRKVSTVVET